ncbi:sugar phosphate isomerase/epimerase [Limnohabitans sp. Rim8]|uniref:sugar phosphate isomerase/epimerase family protein n=1 Tax=Limnohabitans sp. Rim8 TaxID=1100718 RepID=UPI0033058EAA
MAQQFLVYQSMWAMERRCPDGLEWSLDEKLAMIRDAGFNGAGVRFADRSFVKPVTDFLRAHGLSWQAQAYPQTVDDLKPVIEHVLEFGADHLNVQPDVRPYRLEECFPLIDGWRRLAADAGIKMQIETHRNRMTTDLLFTLQLLDHYPDLRLTGDLSHYVVGREFWYPMTDHDQALMHRIIDNCWGFHGRIASREQIQLQLNFAQHQGWVAVFMAWWERGFRQWRAKAGADETLIFLCELGPPEYAMTGADGYELSDRWQESRQLMQQVRDIWHGVSTD